MAESGWLGWEDSDGDGWADAVDMDASEWLESDESWFPDMGLQETLDRMMRDAEIGAVTAVAIPAIISIGLLVLVTNKEVNRSFRSMFNPSVRVR